MIESPPSIQTKNLVDALVLLAKSEIMAQVHRMNEEYLYWDKVKYRIPTGVDSATFWQAVKFSREIGERTLRFGKYVFRFTITEKMSSLLHLFDLNMGGMMGTSGLIPEKDKKMYLVNSIMEEAIASSQMEGASTTRREAKDMLRRQQKPANKSQQMILNNYMTVQYLSEHKDNVFSMENLLAVHRLIASSTLDDSADEGRLRQDDKIVVQNAITGEIVHNPPTHDEVEQMLEDLFVFANEDDMENFIHPIVKGIILHFMLSYIHPFVDGNGRTARSLFYWYLLQKGYWLTEYLSISRIIYRSKEKYERAFLCVEADNLDLSYFIYYNLEAMRIAYDELQKYLARKISERESINKYVGIGNINERQAQLLKFYYNKPEILMYAKEVATRFSVSDITARTDLRHLVQLGLIEEVRVDKKTTAYKCVEDFVERLQALKNSARDL